ncbi:hypothetical protein [Natrononativus amylolyticus]|uniref:hypothetical protein n=1 Tax=Natrononativus amylolyticus TaxID=2963434 RepID=UPI0020CF902E|nr:hypothetical protein [Natrononativus amylolyticus]
MSHPARAARRHIQSDHVAVLDGIDYCADRVAEPWTDGRVSDRSRVVDSLESWLESTGLLAKLPLVLTDAVEAAGYELAAPPVAAPPYVAITSRGPILRATIDPGRLVVRFEAFDVVREPRGYRRLDGVRLAVCLEC